MEEFVQEFKAEAASIIETLQGLLLSYEGSTSKPQIAEELFRGIHTLKGTSKMFGFDSIEQVTHKLEDILDQFRSTGVSFPERFINTLAATLEYADGVLEGRTDKETLQQLLIEIETHEHFTLDSKQGPEQLYCIMLHPQPDIFARGINPVSILNDLSHLGELIFESVTREEVEKQSAKRSLKEATYDFWITTRSGSGAVEDVFIFLKDTEYAVREIPSVDAARQLCEEIEVNTRKTQHGVAGIGRRRESIRAYFDEREGQREAVIDLPETSDKTKSGPPVGPGEQRKLNYVNVALPKLDSMMALVSEFVTLAGKVKFHAAHAGIDELVHVAERLEKASIQFRDNAFSMRLVPIQILSTKLQRYVKDLARQLGKKVRFIADGMETELDRSIINQIEAPLMHIIRNAIDHGLETPEARVAAGKLDEGVLKLSAFYSGTNVFIHLQDDGSGIDLEKVRKKAIEKKIISSHDMLDANELVKLIFRPGFSTADQTTEVSGRGVGMDVVRKQINELRGSVDVTTEKGLGTSLAIRLPLALSIMDVLIVQSGDWKYLLPHSDVEHCTSVRFGGIIERRGSNLRYRDKLIPFLGLAELRSSQQRAEGQEASIVILNKADQLIAIEVDEIIGKDQVVIKPIDEVFGMVPFLGGTTILGDGDLAFLIDGVKLKEQYVR